MGTISQTIITKQAPPPPPRNPATTALLNQSQVILCNNEQSASASATAAKVQPNIIGNERIYTPEEFERSQLYPPPPPKQQQQGSSSEPMLLSVPTKQGPSSSSEQRARSRSKGRSSSSMTTLSQQQQQRTLSLSGDNVTIGTTTEHSRTKSYDNSSFVTDYHEDDDDYGKSNITLNAHDFMSDILFDVKTLQDKVEDNVLRRDDTNNNNNEQHDDDDDNDQDVNNNACFMTKTRQQLSHAKDVLALVSSPTTTSITDDNQVGDYDNNNHIIPPRVVATSTIESANNDQQQQLQQQLEQQQQDESSKHHAGFRLDYSLGETARRSSHMIIETNTQRAIDAVDNTLSSHDFAWIKRSDGTFTYSILAYRSSAALSSSAANYDGDDNDDDDDANANDKQRQVAEDCMTFVLSTAGCTKMIRRSQWGKCVRLVAEATTTEQSLPETVLAPTEQVTEDQHQHEPDVKSNHELELRADEYIKKIREQFYSTRPSAPTPGDPDWVPPATIAFDAAAHDDDVISCVSTPVVTGGVIDNDDDGEKKDQLNERYSLSEPVIREE